MITDQVHFHHLASAPPSVLDETETLRQRVSTNELMLMRSLRRSSEEDYEKLTESAKFRRRAKLARSAKITRSAKLARSAKIKGVAKITKSAKLARSAKILRSAKLIT